jgi:hypothetical protein
MHVLSVLQAVQSTVGTRLSPRRTRSSPRAKSSLLLLTSCGGTSDVTGGVASNKNNRQTAILHLGAVDASSSGIGR